MQTKVPFEAQLDRRLQAQLVELWLNGIYTAIFFITIAALCSRRRRYKTGNIYMILITIAMYSLSTLSSAAYWFEVRETFVNDAVIAAEMSKPIQLNPIPLWVFTCETLSFSINTLLADCLLIWRSWVVWGRDWRIVMPSGILTIIGTVFSVLADIAQFNAQLADIHAKSASSFANSKFFTTTGTVYLALSFGTTSVVTVLIIYRILSINSMNRSITSRVAPDGRNETLPNLNGIVEILVESSLLYAISILSLFILLAMGNPSYVYAQSVVTQITGMAPTLILTRITLGFARQPSTWTTPVGLSSQMRFASTISDPRRRHTTFGSQFSRTEQVKEDSDNIGESANMFA